MNTRNLAARFIAAAAIVVSATGAFAQVTPAEGFTPPDDTPTYKVGAVVFGDYTYIASPATKDSDGNTIHSSSFNISRAYLNLTGSVNHFITFRITPDIARETGSGSSLSGSQTFRLKYAFAQVALDDWTTHGSWVRLGVQQTPYVDYTENIYRYRWQGPIFADREGFITSSDAAISGHWNFPNGYGDIHAGYYNGEGYSKAEANNEKAIQVRASVRPLPLGGIWRGLRMTGFIDEDHYVQGAKRQREIAQVTYEHPLVNAGVEILSAKDRSSVSKSEVDAKGYSIWATPKLGSNGWELLLRHDQLTPNKNNNSQKRKRDIAGLAYWLPNLNKLSAAVMLDRDSLKQSGFTPIRANDTRYGLKMLLIF
jgi:hypothetical protein